MPRMFITSYSPAASATSYVPATVPLNSFSKRYIMSSQAPVAPAQVPLRQGFAPSSTVVPLAPTPLAPAQVPLAPTPLAPAPVPLPVPLPATFRAINTSFRSNMMTSRTNQMAAVAATAVPTPKRFTPESTPPDPAKNLWGGPTWYLFHTLAHKVDENRFDVVRADMLMIIYNIACNLPCPYCAEHARKHLDTVNFQAIQTKEQLKRMLYDFHNIVNQRKGYAIFPYENLDKTYNPAITVNMIQNFMAAFTKKTHNMRLLADDLKRRHIHIKLRTWFQQHHQFFMA